MNKSSKDKSVKTAEVTPKTEVSTVMTTNITADNQGIIQVAVSSIEERLYARIEDIKSKRKVNAAAIKTLQTKSFDLANKTIASYMKKEATAYAKAYAAMFGREIEVKREFLGFRKNDSNVEVIGAQVVFLTKQGQRIASVDFNADIPASLQKLAVESDALEADQKELIRVELDCTRRTKDISRMERRAKAALASQMMIKGGHQDMLDGLTKSVLDADPSLNLLLGAN